MFFGVIFHSTEGDILSARIRGVHGCVPYTSPYPCGGFAYNGKRCQGLCRRVFMLIPGAFTRLFALVAATPESGFVVRNVTGTPPTHPPPPSLSHAFNHTIFHRQNASTCQTPSCNLQEFVCRRHEILRRLRNRYKGLDDDNSACVFASETAVVLRKERLFQEQPASFSFSLVLPDKLTPTFRVRAALLLPPAFLSFPFLSHSKV